MDEQLDTRTILAAALLGMRLDNIDARVIAQQIMTELNRMGYTFELQRKVSPKRGGDGLW